MNILTAIAERDGRRFLEILDQGVKAATRQASVESHARGLKVVDGRGAENLKPCKIKRI